MASKVLSSFHAHQKMIKSEDERKTAAFSCMVHNTASIESSSVNITYLIIWSEKEFAITGVDFYG